MKTKKQDNIGTAPLKLQGNLVTDSKGKAVILLNQFKSVFTRELPEIPGPFTNFVYRYMYIPIMPEIVVDVNGVVKLLKASKISKAMGPN